MMPSFKLLPSMGTLQVDIQKLNFLAQIQPNISFAINQVNIFSNQP